MTVSTELTTLIVLLLSAAITLVPVFTLLIKTYLQLKINSATLSKQPTKDEVENLISTKLDQLADGGSNVKPTE